MYDSSDAKFKNGPNSSMVIEIRIVVTPKNSDWKGTGGFWEMLMFNFLVWVLFPNPM